VKLAAKRPTRFAASPDIIALAPPQPAQGNPDRPLSFGPGRHRAAWGTPHGGNPMSKEKNRGNKEAKKPKKEQPKVLATANSNLGKPLDIGKAKKAK
jgi:hypothetical protein